MQWNEIGSNNRDHQHIFTKKERSEELDAQTKVSELRQDSMVSVPVPMSVPEPNLNDVIYETRQNNKNNDDENNNNINFNVVVIWNNYIEVYEKLLNFWHP